MQGCTGWGDGCSEIQSKSWGTFWNHKSIPGLSPYTYSVAWTLGQAHLKSPVGSHCGKLETGNVAWLCPNSMGT